MIAISQSLLWGAAILAVLLYLSVPLGTLCLRLLPRKLPTEIAFLVALPLGLLLTSGFTTTLRTLGVSANITQMLLFLLTGLAAAGWWLRRGNDGTWGGIWGRNQAIGLVATWLFTSLCLLGAAFPNGTPEDLMIHVVMGLTSLPVDALIPYLVSRYIVEGVSFGAAPVLPEWNVTDRPPLASMVIAAVFTLLGISDSGPLYGATRGVYFVAHVAEMFLNALPILSVWLIGAKYYSRRHGAAAVLLCAVTSFFYQNVIFTWPKFLAAHLLLVGLVLIVYERQYLLAGIMLGCAALSHSVALFYIVALFGLWGVGIALRIALGMVSGTEHLWPRIRCLGTTGVVYLATILPWKIVCWLYPPSPRLTYLHLFCDMSQDMSHKVFGEELRRYWSNHTLGELLAVRWGNLIYPFNLNPGVLAATSSDGDFMRMIDSVSLEAFYRLIWAVGPLSVVLAIAGVSVFAVCHRRYELLAMAAVSVGGFAIAVATFGCANWALNHHWSYGMYLLIMLAAGIFVASGNILGLLGFVLTFSVNLFWLLYHGLFKNEIRAFTFTNANVLIAQGVLLGVFCLLFFVQLCRVEEGELRTGS